MSGMDTSMPDTFMEFVELLQYTGSAVILSEGRSPKSKNLRILTVRAI